MNFYEMMFQRIRDPNKRRLYSELFSWISFIVIITAMLSVAYDNFTYKASCIEKFKASCPCLVSPEQKQTLIAEFGDNMSYSVLDSFSNTSSSVS